MAAELAGQKSVVGEEVRLEKREECEDLRVMVIWAKRGLFRCFLGTMTATRNQLGAGAELRKSAD